MIVCISSYIAFLSGKNKIFCDAETSKAILKRKKRCEPPQTFVCGGSP